MVATPQSASTIAVQTDGTLGVTVTAPTGIQTGDLLIVLLSQNTANSSWATTDSGWTFHQAVEGSSVSGAWGEKTAVLADETETDYTFTNGVAAADQKCGRIFRVDGQHASWLAFTPTANVLAAQPTAVNQSETTGEDNVLLFRASAVDRNRCSNATSSGGLSDVATADSSETSSGCGLCCGWELQASAGATGTHSWTLGDSASEQSVNWTIGIRSAAAGGTPSGPIDAVEVTTELTSPGTTAIFSRSALSMESAVEVDVATGSALRLAQADDMESSVEVGAASVTALFGVGADDVESASEITSPTVARDLAAIGDNMEIATEIETPALTRLRVAVVDVMEAASELTSPAALTGLAALPFSMQVSAEIDQVGAVVVKATIANDMDVTTELSQAGVTAILAAIAASMEVATEIDEALYSALQDGNLMRTIELLGEVGGKSKQNFVMVSGDAVRIAVTVTKADVAQNLTNVTIRVKFFPPRTSIALFEKITGVEVIIDDAANGHFYFDIDKEDTENFRGRLNWVAEGTDTLDQQATFINKSHARVDPDRIT